MKTPLKADVFKTSLRFLFLKVFSSELLTICSSYKAHWMYHNADF